MNTLTKIIAAILVAAAVALASFAWWLGRTPPAPPISSATAGPNSKAAIVEYPVVVPVRTLAAGTLITADALQVVKLPMNPAGAYRDVNAVAGKMPAAEIAAGMPITERALSNSLAMQLAKGERAVAVPVDEIVGAGNRVEPGDYVDVFFTLKQALEIEKSQTRLLVSRLRVLSYGETAVGGAQGATHSKAASNGKPLARPAHSAVLAVPVADVNRLVLATQNGKLLLAPRHPMDDVQPDVALFAAPAPVLNGKAGLSRGQADMLKTPENQAYAGVELTALANHAGGTHPRSSPAVSVAAANPRSSAAHTVEVIRGTRRESVPF
ncbi:MAG: Flp pilus assembly protein CpaB [Noviherbaspirillum sp.]